MDLSFETLKKQFMGFVVTGCVSTGIMFLIYLGLNHLMNYQWSYALAYVISVLLLYFMNNFFIFKNPFSLNTFLKFPLIYLIQYLLGAMSLEFLVRLGFSVTYAPLVIIIILLPLTFYLNRVLLLHQR